MLKRGNGSSESARRCSAVRVVGGMFLGLVLTTTPGMGPCGWTASGATWAADGEPSAERGDMEPPAMESRDVVEPGEDCGCKRRFKRLDTPMVPKGEGAEGAGAPASETKENGEGARPAN